MSDSTFIILVTIVAAPLVVAFAAGLFVLWQLFEWWCLPFYVWLAAVTMLCRDSIK